MSITQRIQTCYPKAQEGSGYVSAVRDFLFWCRDKRKNPVPIALDGVRSTGHWVDAGELSGWTLLEYIELMPENEVERGNFPDRSSHIQSYVRVAGDGRDNAVQFFADLMNELGFDELKVVLDESDRSMMRVLSGGRGPGPVFHDEFYDRSEIESRFGELTSQIMKECAESPEGMVDGKTLCEWIHKQDNES